MKFKITENKQILINIFSSIIAFTISIVINFLLKLINMSFWKYFTSLEGCIYCKLKLDMFLTIFNSKKEITGKGDFSGKD